MAQTHASRALDHTCIDPFRKKRTGFGPHCCDEHIYDYNAAHEIDPVMRGTLRPLSCVTAQRKNMSFECPWDFRATVVTQAPSGFAASCRGVQLFGNTCHDPLAPASPSDVNGK